MKIQSLNIKNFRGFEDITIPFSASNVCVFIGENGSGKTSLLDLLSNFLVRLISDVSIYYTPLNPIVLTETLTNDDILLTENSFESTLNLEINTKKYALKINKSIGQNSTQEWILKNTEIWNTDLIPPIMVLYPADRNLRYVSSITTQNQIDNPLFTYHLAFSKSLDFQDFYDWFRSEEDKENEQKIRTRNLDYSSFHLQNIRSAIDLFFSTLGGVQFSDLRAERNENDIKEGFKANFTSTLTILKENQRFKLQQLSDGEKGLLMIVADIARRISIVNASIKTGNGVVLIDEIELHLHPKWQERVIPALQNTFPKIQFIITTHSPQVLSNIEKNNIRILKDSQVFQPSIETLGNDTNSILPLMGKTVRPIEVDKELDLIFDLINDQEFDAAQKRGQDLIKNKKISSNDAVFKRIESLRNRMQILQK
jgi:predicted ATP-binding protein involved in virulence